MSNKDLRISCRKLHVKKCKAAATGKTYYDSLTGLPNRALFYDRLAQALAFARRNNKTAAVLFISLDNIKLINDTLGQACGDLLLKAIAKEIKDSLRRSDTVARPGRDEFMILLPEVGADADAAIVAGKIFTLLETPFIIEKHELFLSSNIGISIFPHDGEDAVELLKNAYTALQRAREAGKNTYKFYSLDMNARAFHRMMTENSLRLALRRDEFFLEYQPQIDLCTGAASGMEALVRWNRPGYGIVYPGEFIPIMEETRLIADLGEWTLREACTQNLRWQKAGLRPIRIAVNLSACQFHMGDIPETVGRVLEETGLCPSYLELELTETAFMHNPEAAINSIRRLREMGVYLSLDDFGTGYSSLNYLKYFPISRLKIVAPFISSIAVTASEAAIARAIVAMAHSLDIGVIAEGVEKMEDLEFIYSLECDEVQGHIFSLPLSAEEGLSFLSNEKLFTPMARGV